MTIQTDREQLAGVKEEYQYGFHDKEQPFFKAERGLNHAVIDQISDHKNEPDWMRQFRHEALDIFLAKPMPTWGEDLSGIDFSEIFSIAFAGKGQHQDAGGKVVHGAPYTSSKIVSKSISKDGGRASYRGMLKVAKGAHHSKSHVVCDALLLDADSRSDTYPYIEIEEENVSVGHEASVSKIGEEQLFYLQSRGIGEDEAAAMIVGGFIEPLVKELPMEYAVEMNRLIQLQMEGSIG